MRLADAVVGRTRVCRALCLCRLLRGGRNVSPDARLTQNATGFAASAACLGGRADPERGDFSCRCRCSTENY